MFTAMIDCQGSYNCVLPLTSQDVSLVLVRAEFCPAKLTPGFRFVFYLPCAPSTHRDLDTKSRNIIVDSPWRNVWCFANTHGSARIYKRSDCIVISGGENKLLVLWWGPSFFASNEAGADPDARRSISTSEEHSSTIRVAYREIAYERATARPRPSEIPPAATTIMGWPVKGLFASLQRSTTAGMRIENGISPVWPPPSPPCAQIISTPGRRNVYYVSRYKQILA